MTLSVTTGADSAFVQVSSSANADSADKLASKDGQVSTTPKSVVDVVDGAHENVVVAASEVEDVVTVPVESEEEAVSDEAASKKRVNDEAETEEKSPSKVAKVQDEPVSEGAEPEGESESPVEKEGDGPVEEAGGNDAFEKALEAVSDSSDDAGNECAEEA
jgi:hypothetical protein